MKLWTWQGADFNITSDRVDHTKSSYYQRNHPPGIRAAYAELSSSNHLDTDQFLWCYVDRDEGLKARHNETLLWRLDVPEIAILKFTNDWVWERIIGSDAYPHSLDSQWAMSAPEDETARLEYIERKIKEYHMQSPPAGGWWTQLFVTYPPKPPGVELVSALLRSPVDKSWVLRDPRRS